MSNPTECTRQVLYTFYKQKTQEFKLFTCTNKSYWQVASFHTALQGRDDTIHAWEMWPPYCFLCGTRAAVPPKPMTKGHSCDPHLNPCSYDWTRLVPHGRNKFKCMVKDSLSDQIKKKYIAMGYIKNRIKKKRVTWQSWNKDESWLITTLDSDFD